MNNLTNITKNELSEEEKKIFCEADAILVILGCQPLLDIEIQYFSKIKCNIPNNLPESCYGYYIAAMVLAMRNPICNKDIIIKFKDLLNCSKCNINLIEIFNKYRQKQRFIQFCGTSELNKC